MRSRRSRTWCAPRAWSASCSGCRRIWTARKGPRAEKSRAVAHLLTEATGLEVVLWDERRSSIEAHGILHANGRKEKKHRRTVDAVAASLILEGYLGTLR